MKNTIITICLLVLFCSCAGTAQQGLIKIPEQSFSFMEPPSNWKKAISTTSSSLPTGETIPGGVYLGSWQTSSNSRITILACSQTEESRKASNKESIRIGLLVWRNALDREHYCGSSHQIDDENIGLFRGKYKYYEIESTVTCTFDPELVVKRLDLIIDTEEHKYGFELIDIENNFANSRMVLDQLLESIVFTESNSTK